MKSQSIETGVMLRVWGLLIGVFLLGTVVGISLDAIYRSNQSASRPVTSMRNADAYLTSLKRDLDLSDEQAESLRLILDETREEYRGVCADVRPRYDALRERARGRIRALLSPSQQQQFESVVEREDCAKCPDRDR